jgi:hypothetical protein
MCDENSTKPVFSPEIADLCNDNPCPNGNCKSCQCKRQPSQSCQPLTHYVCKPSPPKSAP